MSSIVLTADWLWSSTTRIGCFAIGWHCWGRSRTCCLLLQHCNLKEDERPSVRESQNSSCTTGVAARNRLVKLADFTDSDAHFKFGHYLYFRHRLVLTWRNCCVWQTGNNQTWLKTFMPYVSFQWRAKYQRPSKTLILLQRSLDTGSKFASWVICKKTTVIFSKRWEGERLDLWPCRWHNIKTSH